MPGPAKQGPTPYRVDSQAAFFKALSGSGSATTEVATDPRVFERITLGLYREPSAAIRELISNAYDADATEIKIVMNPPSFAEIVIEDNGIGMSAAAIEQIVHHVGGSLKRSTTGKDAGVTRSSGVSPAGRKLIGQMGIGLYSVARLTRHFVIETKQKDKQHSVILEIDLTGLDPANLPEEGAEKYVAGYAKVSREQVKLADAKRSYTRIRLTDVLPEARRILQSVDRWDDFYAKAEHRSRGDMQFHIGRIFPPMKANLPWSRSDEPQSKFRLLVDALSTTAEASPSSPSLDQTLDYYLAMLWRISLSAPLAYMAEHPFYLTNQSDVDFYSLDGDQTPELITLRPGETIGEHVGVAEEGSSPTPFKLIVDEIELRRPIVFRGFVPTGNKLVERPKLFVGKYANSQDGANLKGSGYFFWSYETKPKENNGALVRIAGASGTLFDSAFLGFRTSENVRLRQVSSELFTSSGLENALNVDRESFVDSDTNYRALQRWTHRSMTRLFSRLKADQRELATKRKLAEETAEAAVTEAESVKIYAARRGTTKRKAPQVYVSSKSDRPATVSETALFVGSIPSSKRGGVETEQVFSARLRSIVRVLDAWGLLDGLDATEQSALLTDLSRVLSRD